MTLPPLSQHDLVFQEMLRQDLIKWLYDENERNEFAYQLDSIDITICIQRGYAIYPQRNLLNRSTKIPSQIRVVPNSTKLQNLIQTLFNPPNESVYTLKESPKKKKFEIHFFETRRELIDQETIIKERDEQLRRPLFCLLM